MAFINGELEEEVYMEQPEGFKVPGKEHLVCLLRESSYGLKQSCLRWHIKIDSFLIEKLNMHRNYADECFYSLCQDGLVLLVALYVDDLLIACNRIVKLNEVKTASSSVFCMKDLQEACSYLGFEMHCDTSRGTLHLSQLKYSTSVLTRFGTESANGCSTPMEPDVDLFAAGSPVIEFSYRKAIGSLMYLMVGTRPDISFAVSCLAKFVNTPTEFHWQAVKRLLRYVKNTTDYAPCYTSSKESEPTVYVDADWT